MFAACLGEYTLLNTANKVCSKQILDHSIIFLQLACSPNAESHTFPQLKFRDLEDINDI